MSAVLASVNEILEYIASLPEQDQRLVLETADKRLHWIGRERIVQSAAEAKRELAEGRVETGTVKELMASLNDD